VAGHWISLGITVAMMVLVNFFMYHTLPQRKDDDGVPLRGFKRYAPLTCTMVAAPLILLDLCRHALQDKGVWAECQRDCAYAKSQGVDVKMTGTVKVEGVEKLTCYVPAKDGETQPCPSKNCTGIAWAEYCDESSSQYKCAVASDSSCVPDAHENMAHLSTIGVLFTICFTYLGFLFLMVGVMWNAKILTQLAKMGDLWNEIRGNPKPIKVRQPKGSNV